MFRRFKNLSVKLGPLTSGFFWHCWGSIPDPKHLQIFLRTICALKEHFVQKIANDHLLWKQHLGDATLYFCQISSGGYVHLAVLFSVGRNSDWGTLRRRFIQNLAIFHQYLALSQELHKIGPEWEGRVVYPGVGGALLLPLFTVSACV